MSPLPAVIRPFAPDELDRVAQVWFDSTSATSLGTVTIADLRARLRDEGADWTIHVAWVGPDLAGFAALSLVERWLRQLFVAPAHQGQGVGQALLNRAKADLPGGLWLRTDATNHRARQFYERAGLVLAEVDRHSVHGHEVARYVWPGEQ